MRATTALRAGAGLATTVGAAALGRWVHAKVGRVAAPVGITADPDEVAAAEALLARHPAIDMHAHPGRTFVRGATRLSPPVRLYAMRGTFEDRVLAEAHDGGVAAICVNAVPDFPTLGLAKGGLRMARPFEPGEAWAAYRLQIGNLAALADRAGAESVRTPADLAAARTRGALGLILGVEGADFLDGRLERVGEVFDDGVRVVTLVHFYRGGPIGDVMTDTPVHGGLTTFGREVVREMNRTGIVVDLSHATEETAYAALDVATKPLLLSHTDLLTTTARHPRFVSSGLAEAVAGAGGVVGAWPAGITLGSLDDFAARIVELVDRLGADHVGIGTDMDANDRPVFESYAKLPLLVVALRRRGLTDGTLARVLGGNYLRVMGAALDA
jgi:membrane dipeptidase